MFSQWESARKGERKETVVQRVSGENGRKHLRGCGGVRCWNTAGGSAFGSAREQNG